MFKWVVFGTMLALLLGALAIVTIPQTRCVVLKGGEYRTEPYLGSYCTT